MDLSTSSIDGSHTKALRGGEEVDFQTRKMCKTTNTLYLPDNQGLPLVIYSPVAGNHHDLFQIGGRLEELFVTLGQAKIATDGLFVNADTGFDSNRFRRKCLEYGIIANTALNPRNGSGDQNIVFDEELYENRYSIEKTNVCMDSYRTLLNRFNSTVVSWKAFNYIAFTIILLNKINKNKKNKDNLYIYLLYSHDT